MTLQGRPNDTSFIPGLVAGALAPAREEILTPRLTLRPAHMGDARALARQADDLELARMTSGTPFPCSFEFLEGALAGSLAADPARERLFVIETEDDGPIGMLGFHRNDHGVTEVGYWLGRDHRGRGYMTEALSAALNWAARRWGRRQIASGHFEDNAASAAVLIKAGFLYTGDVRLRRSLAREAPTPTRMMIWIP